MRALAVALAALISTLALAADESSPSRSRFRLGGETVTSVLSGKSLEGTTVFHGQVGFPGLALTLLTGASDKLDVGGRVSFLYAYEGITGLPSTPGIKLQGILRLQLLDRGKINLGVRFSPGIFFYSFPGWTETGLALPLDVAFGYAIAPSLMLNVGLDVPMFIPFGPYGALAAPVLFGGGVEYALDRQLALTVNLRAGPSVPITGNIPIAGPWANVWCVDQFGQLYWCGYYRYNLPAAEALIGISYKL
ncbi:MAG TPA: hypothetical protein VE782_09995 [Myxococcaceae bacterium]|jgi:hypothetical protein|nr:hypothetical protein [Myxococcaceae bacterium]